jgi:hypothetical protein
VSPYASIWRGALERAEAEPNPALRAMRLRELAAVLIDENARLVEQAIRVADRTPVRLELSPRVVLDTAAPCPVCGGSLRDVHHPAAGDSAVGTLRWCLTAADRVLAGARP